MSENAKRRQTAANALVRVLQGASSLPGPSEPANPLGRLELLRGGEFKAWDARVDAVARLQRLPLNELSTRCLRAVQRVTDEPSVQRIRLARRLLFRESKRQDLPYDITKEFAVAHELLAFNLSAMGCEQANAEVTAAALLQFNALLNHARYEDAYLCLRTALVWAGETEFDNTDRPYYPEPNYAYLSEFHLHTEHFLEFATALHDAEKALREQDDVLRGGVGQLAPKDGDLAVELDGLEAGVSPPAAETPAPEPPTPGRSLVVVGSLDHLAKPSKAALERRDSPRAEYDRIENKPLPLLPAPDPHAFVEEGSARAPWLRPIFEILAQDLVGAPYAWLRPTALVSPPGFGKTATVRAIARGLGLPLRVYNAAGASDGSFGGTSRQWGTGRGAIPLQTALNESVANCIIGVDEIEKSSLDRRNGSLVDTLLPYLERESSKSIFDIYIEANVNLSAFTYLVTANTISGVPGPLLDRLRILEVPAPGVEHLPIVAANILSEIRRERGLDATWLPDLDGDELDLLASYWRGGSLRPLCRLVETLLAGRDRLAPRH